jgi:hypothetical protein
MKGVEASFEYKSVFSFIVMNIRKIYAKAFNFKDQVAGKEDRALGYFEIFNLISPKDKKVEIFVPFGGEEVEILNVL